MKMDEEQDLLDSLLAVATEHLDELTEKRNIQNHSVQTDPPSKTKVLRETDIFQLETNLNNRPQNKLNSVIHTGDTDSSDDEGNRNYEDQKYNEYGREIKSLLNTNDSGHSISTSHYGVPKKRVSNWKDNPNNDSTSKSTLKLSNKASSSEQKFQDVFLDPVFSMRIVNPKISSAMLTEKMQGRLAVRFSDVAKQLFAGNLKEKDWVICGVVVNKSPPKTSQKGSEYSIWTLSDLKDDIKTVALFMFSSAHKDLWKTMVGTVIGVLNPNIMDRRDGSKDEACLSIDSAQKLMVFGQSKDFGICKSIKKNGDKCTAIVNLSRCEYCIYHIKQEYQKCSKRSELQANFAGKGLVNLRNKVLGKNEVFYAGKSYVAIPAKKNRKLEARDNNILQNLNSINGKSSNIVKAKNVTNKKKGLARHLDVNPAQRARDLELLKKLGAANLESKNMFSGIRSDEISLEDSKATALSVINKLKAKKDSTEDNIVVKNSQYDLKGDLFVNVEGKSKFSGTFSGNVSLESSKNIALTVISKLKAKKTESKPVSPNTEHDGEELLSLDNSDLTELNYSDEEGNDANFAKGTSTSTSTTPSKLEEKHESLKSTAGYSSLSKSKNVNEEVVSDSPKCLSKNNHNQKVTLSNRTDKGQNIDTPRNSLHKSPSNLDKISMGVPMLSGFGKGDFIDLSKPIKPRHIDRAKANALKYIQRNGPIKKVDPNNTKGSESKKRNIENVIHTGTRKTDNIQSIGENSAKKSKLQESEFISDRFKKMMAMSSKHADLLEHHDDQEKEKYFNKLEAKEKMEEKMTNTHKVKCKAVKCLQCKYTSFSASELCKSERHPLKVFDAMKRFYKCSNCQNRTVTVEFVPTRPCSNCGSSKWEKTGMMKEKIAVVQHNLSIRGGEQKFVNSVAADANLDLLVPDE